MPYYAGDYYAGDPGPLGPLARIGGGALAKLGGGGALKKLGAALGLGAAFGAGEELVERGAEAVSEAVGGGGGRRYRRMNVLNPRALRRSMRRVQGFARFASKTIQFTKRHKLKKRRR